MADLISKVVLITGASAGIGEGVAIHFASLGARLSLTGRNTTALKNVVDRCLALNTISVDDILCTPADLTKDEDQTNLVEKTIQMFGKIDVLVNNAGMIMYATTEKTSPEIYDTQMNTNVRSHFFLTQKVIPCLKSSKGCIVNIGSICGSRAMPNVTTYCMSKAAMDSFTQCLALELAPFGIRVNSVNPGTIKSMIARREYSAYKDDEDYSKFLEIQKKIHPLGRVGEPDDVAKAVAFLASDAASFVSGDLMYVDGARHCVSASVATSVK